jgi:hypothetical protein
VDITPADALSMRMASLLLRPHPRGNPGDVAGVVEWFGAMQAQDVASGLWSLGVRLPGSTLADIEAALERREAIRTWPMRGTVHLVPSADAHWMLDLMGVRALAGVAARRAVIGLDEATADRGVDILAEALAGGKRLTRAGCLAALTAGGVTISGPLGYHLLWYASQRGVTCIAPHIGKEQTFVLLDEWVPKLHRPERDEALGLITRRYFRSHGPTTRQDFAGWTGLTMTDVRKGLAVAGDDLTAVRVGGVEMIVDPALLDEPRPPVDDLHTLPGFDEYLLGFKDRSLMLDDDHKQAVIPGNNGIFQSTIVHGGRVAGTWKRTLGKKAVTIDATALVPLTAAARKKAELSFTAYAAYLGLPPVVRWA